MAGILNANVCDQRELRVSGDTGKMTRGGDWSATGGPGSWRRKKGPVLEVIQRWHHAGHAQLLGLSSKGDGALPKGFK